MSLIIWLSFGSWFWCFCSGASQRSRQPVSSRQPFQLNSCNTPGVRHVHGTTQHTQLGNTVHVARGQFRYVFFFYVLVETKWELYDELMLFIRGSERGLQRMLISLRVRCVCQWTLHIHHMIHYDPHLEMLCVALKTHLCIPFMWRK